ncbi:MAG: hypothetical protein AAF830_10120 [Pseudomonadota bacterium]
MTWGNTKSSRIKISIVGLLGSLFLILLPLVMAYAELGLSSLSGRDKGVPFDISVPLLAFSTLFLIGLFGVATFLGVLSSHLVTIEANAQGTAKLLGIEMPFEVRGATVLLLILYLFLLLFIVAFDLDQQWTVKALHRQNVALKEDLERERAIQKAINAIHTGQHIDDIPMLRLSYHCGGNSEREQISEWSRFDKAKGTADPEPRKPIPIAFPVSPRYEFVYRVKYRDDSAQDFGRSPIRVHTKLDADGALRAEIFMASPEAYRELWSFCRNDEAFVRDEEQIAEDKLDPTVSGDR